MKAWRQHRVTTEHSSSNIPIGIKSQRFFYSGVPNIKESVMAEGGKKASSKKSTERHNTDIREREYERRFAMLLATAWSDKAFMQRLLQEPQKCFEEFGLSVPEGRKVHVHVDTAQDLHIVIPDKPPAFDEAIVVEPANRCWKSSKCWNLCD